MLIDLTSSLPYRIIFQLIMVVIYPTVIQPFFNKLSPLAEGDLRTRIENLATKLSFPLKHLYEIDGSKRSSHSNAYFFGLPWVNIEPLSQIFGMLELIFYSRANISSYLTHSSKRASQRKLKPSLVRSPPFFFKTLPLFSPAIYSS